MSSSFLCAYVKRERKYKNIEVYISVQILYVKYYVMSVLLHIYVLHKNIKNTNNCKKQVAHVW